MPFVRTSFPATRLTLPAGLTKYVPASSEKYAPPLESATTSPIRQNVLSPNLLARISRVGCKTTSSAASLHSAGRPPGSEHVLSAPMRRPLLSYARAPVPWVSLTKIENLSLGSSMPTVLGCSCANNRPPSFVPMIPSALSGPCQTSFHLAPAAMTPGIAVTNTSFAAVGCGKVFGCCAAAIAPKQKAIVNVTLNFIGLHVGWQESTSDSTLRHGVSPASAPQRLVTHSRVASAKGSRYSR